jgi:Homeodomain-like domain
VTEHENTAHESAERLFTALEDDDPSKSLASVAALRSLVDRQEAIQVRRARDSGWTWRQIGAILGVSRQAVHKKHSGRRDI